MYDAWYSSIDDAHAASSQRNAAKSVSASIVNTAFIILALSIDDSAAPPINSRAEPCRVKSYPSPILVLSCLGVATWDAPAIFGFVTVTGHILL